MAEARLSGADFVRAIACLSVLAHHVVQRLAPGTLPPAWKPVYDFFHMGSFGVAAFFVLSGYLLSRPFWVAYDQGAAMPSLRGFALRRAARIVPGFWLALTVTFVLSVTLFAVPLDGQLWARYLVGLLMVGDFHFVTFFPVEFNGPPWSISFEVTSYVLLPLLLIVMFALRRWIGRYGGIVAWAAVVAAMLWLHYLIMRYWPIDNEGRSWSEGMVGGAKYWMPRFNPIGFFALFAIGALTAALQVQAARWRSWLFDVFAIGGLVLAGWAMADYGPKADGAGFGWLKLPYGFPWYPVGVALVLLATPSSRIVAWAMDNPAARYIARISFGIYLWHYLIIEVLRVVWNRDASYQGIHDLGAWGMFTVVAIAISVVVAHLSYVAIEAPVIQWARGLEKQRTADTRQTAAA